MPLDKLVLEQALKATHMLLDKQPVNPWLIAVDLNTPNPPSSIPYSVELRLGLAILVFEMQQCNVQVDEQTVLSFVQQEIKTHQSVAVEGYLNVGRDIISPKPARKSNSWFSRVFTSPPKWMLERSACPLKMPW